MALFQPAIIIVLIFGVVSGQEMCRPNSPRTDCGYVGIDEYECEGKGCCWTPAEGQAYCYHKSTAPPSYKVGTVSEIAFGVRMTVDADPSASSEFGSLLTPLSVDIVMESSSRLHVKIKPKNDKSRWEIPDNVSSAGTLPSQHPTNLLFNYTVAKVGEYFYFAVQRLSDEEVIFNSSFVGQPLEFSDQFVAIATTLPGTESLYGLGERKGRLVLERGKTYTLWNIDTSPEPGLNSYSSHPFYMDLCQSGMAHGVYMRNSNGMDVIYDDGFLTYRMTGGVLDMYFFLGPTPEGVVQQYQEVIGRPQLPPYWALGFHQCRYGYIDVQSLRDVVGNYSANKIPLDGIWSDIDYMDEYKVFTLDSSNYPIDEVKQFVSNLHKNKQQYVVVVNPGIKVDENYKPYTDGMENKVFIMNKDGEEFSGKQWPGIVVYPDFFKDNVTSQYWTNQVLKCILLQR